MPATSGPRPTRKEKRQEPRLPVSRTALPPDFDSPPVSRHVVNIHRRPDDTGSRRAVRTGTIRSSNQAVLKQPIDPACSSVYLVLVGSALLKASVYEDAAFGLLRPGLDFPRPIGHLRRMRHGRLIGTRRRKIRLDRDLVRGHWRHFGRSGRNAKLHSGPRIGGVAVLGCGRDAMIHLRSADHQQPDLRHVLHREPHAFTPQP